MKPGEPGNEVEKIKELFLPTREKMIQSMRYLGLGEVKIKHVCDLADLSLKIAGEVEKQTGIKSNKEILEAGALFHDIGLAKSYKDPELEPEVYPSHCVIGADIIRKLGLPERVARCAEVHEFGGGITRKEAEELRFPILPYKNSYAPQNLEEAIVTVADCFLFVEEVKERGWEGYDLWKNPESLKDLYYNYINDIYKKILEREITKEHPILDRLYNINKIFFKYVKPEFLK
jgi:putative nucleotidyltransferase with HDIG domain